MQVISTGLAPLLVPVRDEATLRRAEAPRRPMSAGRRRRPAASASTCSRSEGDGDVMARLFDASFGVGEDPATGSAAGPLGVYLASAASPGCPATRSSHRELVGRPSFLHLDVRPDGGSWTSGRRRGADRGEGVFRVPD